MSIWIGIECSEENKTVRILNVSTDLSRAEALKVAIARSEPGYEVTVIDFSQDFDSLAREMRGFLADCAVPDTGLVMQAIGQAMKDELLGAKGRRRIVQKAMHRLRRNDAKRRRTLANFERNLS